MAEIINMSDKIIGHEEIIDVRKAFEALVLETEGEGFNAGQALASILTLEEDQFSLVAPGVLQSFQQSINNPTDKLALTQTLNAFGKSAEDLMVNFTEFAEQIEQIDLSEPKKDFLKQFLGTIVNAIEETEGIAKRTIQVPFELCHPEARIPQYANITDSGMDVYAIDDFTINPGETRLIPTGLKVAIPVGYELQVRPKSGRALKTKLRIANTPGTIDAGYRDEIGIIVENIEPQIKDIAYHYDDSTMPPRLVLDSILHGSAYTIGKGEKFCQLVLAETPKVAAYRVEKVLEIGENRDGGFGSTGLM